MTSQNGASSPVRPIVVAITTIGRVAAMRELLASLETQLEEADVCSIVSQGEHDGIAALCEDLRPSLRASLVLSRSPRGISTGRNTAVEAALRLVEGDALILFPNDTTTYPPGALAAVRTAMVDEGAGAMTVVTDDGPRFHLPAPGAPLTPRTVWSVIEPGLVLRRSTYELLGGFDERIGSGASTPWQAGEGTDLLLRYLRAGDRTFRWIPRDAAEVRGVGEPHGLSASERRRKLRAYGRGIGHVYRIHGYPLSAKVRIVLGGLLVGVRRRGEYELLDGWAGAVGRLEGLTGSTFGRAIRSAVTR